MGYGGIARAVRHVILYGVDPCGGGVHRTGHCHACGDVSVVVVRGGIAGLCVCGADLYGHVGRTGQGDDRWSTVSRNNTESNDVHGAPVNAARLHAAINTGYKVGYAVAVKVAHGCYGFAKVIMVGQDGAVWRGAVDLRGALYSAVGVHQHNVYGAPAVVATNTLAVVAIGAGCQIGHTVAVKVAHGCHGRTKVIMVGQDGAVWCGVVDLRGALYSAVGVHQHDVHGAPVGASPVVEIASYCHI